MIRGLVHRQILGVLEGALWLTLVAIGGSALLGIYRGGGAIDLTPGNPEVQAVELLNPVEDRSHYEVILDSHIFGDAAGYVHNAPKVEKPPPPPPPTEAVNTSLPLELKGVTFLGEESPFSNVIINIKEKGIGSRTFFLGEEVIDNVYLAKVSKESIELDNKRANRREKLEYKLDVTGQPGGRAPEKQELAATDATRATAPAPRARPAAQSLVTLSRDDIVKKLEDDYERLASTVDVKEVKDDEGNVKGLTADNIESIPSLNELGFKNGDVLVSINNEMVTSQNQIAEIANKYRNATIVRVGILRENQPLSFTYRIR